MNKESLPLIIALLVPILFALLILLYFYGYDVTIYLRMIPLIYYVIVLPIALGFTVAIVKCLRPD